eukprot:9317752-Pyramimonas_sp.AAC.1
MVDHTAVIQNGIMIGFGHRRAAREFSTTAVPMTIVPQNDMLLDAQEQALLGPDGSKLVIYDKEEGRVNSKVLDTGCMSVCLSVCLPPRHPRQGGGPGQLQ